MRIRGQNKAEDVDDVDVPVRRRGGMTTTRTPVPATPYVQYTPPRGSRTIPLWTAPVVGIAGLVAGVAIGNSSSTSTAAPRTTSLAQKPETSAAPAPARADGAAADVTLGTFTVDELGDITVPVTIVNHSSKTSNYIIEFEADDASGTKIADGIASTDNVAPGQKSNVTGATLDSNGTPKTVKIDKVTRYAS